MERRNNLILLKGNLTSAPRKPRSIETNIPKGTLVDEAKLQFLIDSLTNQQAYWKDKSIIQEALVSVTYRSIIAKSNRMQSLLSDASHHADDTIVGAKYSLDQKRHIITHLIPKDLIGASIILLTTAKEILIEQFDGIITAETITSVHKGKTAYDATELQWKKFSQVIHDAYYIDSFNTEEAPPYEGDESLITTFFAIKKTAKELLEIFKIPYDQGKEAGEQTLCLTGKEYRTIQEKAPYLISMEVYDLLDFHTASV